MTQSHAIFNGRYVLILRVWWGLANLNFGMRIVCSLWRTVEHCVSVYVQLLPSSMEWDLRGSESPNGFYHTGERESIFFFKSAKVRTVKLLDNRAVYVVSKSTIIQKTCWYPNFSPEPSLSNWLLEFYFVLSYFFSRAGQYERPWIFAYSRRCLGLFLFVQHHVCFTLQTFHTLERIKYG